jgi:lipoprotein NlpD
MKKSLDTLVSHAFGGLIMICVLTLTGCVSSGRSSPAPVEDHPTFKKKQPTKSTTAPSTSAPAVASSAPAPDPAAKSGYYTVKQGDTLIRIGLDHGQNWRDIMRWNALENPNLIEVGQVLRVAPPSVNAASEEVVVKPVTPPGNVAGSQVEAKPNPQNQAPAANTPAPEVSEEQLTFMWPVQGNVLAGFDDAKNKGIDIGGKLGEPVLASADGKVVYAGSGLRGYGNLVILKHNNTYLTAYAHNQTLLVKEDQQVKRGQKIAEMGNSDSEQVKLHFEIRKLGKPVDPAKLLAPR